MRAARDELPARISPPAAERIFDADHDHAGVREGRIQRQVRAHRDEPRGSGQSKIRFVSDGASFFLILLKVITVFSPLRIFVPISAAAFSLGAAYAAWTAFTQQHITNSSVLLIVLAVVIFLVGLVSEQISTLRSEGPR